MATRPSKMAPAEIAGMIERAALLLREAAHPDKIVLFGSYARGDFDDCSDLDLLVILPTVENRIGEMVRLRRVLKAIPMAIDIVVYSTAQVEDRRDLPGTMLFHALREGPVLHDGAIQA